MILNALRELAPEHLAEAWDKAGLQIGDPAWPVRRGLLCIDLTEDVLAEAVAGKAQLIVAYHPLIFDPLTALTIGEPKQRIALKAAQARIAVYSPHTALDAAVGGLNDWLAAGLGAGCAGPIRPAGAPGQYKLVTFVPPAQADGLRRALSAAGAGNIGHYSECSFSVAGQGTFHGGPGTKPSVGRAGRLERVDELRLEMLCPADSLAQAVAALRANHPYQEAAFDVYPLQAPPIDQGHLPGALPGAGSLPGAGRIVELERPVGLATLIGRIKKHLGVKHLEVGAPNGMQKIRRIGLCAGAGGSLLTPGNPPAPGSALATTPANTVSGHGKIDLFFTGEMRHHAVLAAISRGVAVVLAGHTQTERPYLPVYRRRIQKALGGGQVTWAISRADRPPTAIA